MLELKNIRAGYGNSEVLKGVSLAAGKGEIVALIGPNGAGKSTVLKSIMNLAGLSNGSIAWKGKDIARLPTHSLLEEGIGFVPQGRLVFPSLTVAENLEMGAYLLDHKETAARNLKLVLDYFPVLNRRRRDKAGTLSGGEQQMLAVGRALMMTPELLMLDEPSLGLSPKATEAVFEKLKEINRAGVTLIIVEQNVRLVLRYAHRGYLLVNGSVRFEGNAEELGTERLMHEAFLI